MSVNQKFNIAALQEAVQWAIDDVYAERQPARPGVYSGNHWLQNTWGTGYATDLTLIADGMKYRKVKCDSGCCISGHLSMAAGDKFVVADEVVVWTDDTVDVDKCITPEGDLKKISTRGAEILGLDPASIPGGPDMLPLFGGANGIADVIVHAAELAEQYGHVLSLDHRGMEDVKQDAEGYAYGVPLNVRWVTA